MNDTGCWEVGLQWEKMEVEEDAKTEESQLCGCSSGDVHAEQTVQSIGIE